MKGYSPDNPKGGAIERASTLDLSIALQEFDACNLKLMALHMEYPFAEVVEKDFLAPEPEPPLPGTWILAKPEPGGEEDIAGRKLFAEKEKMFAVLHKKFDSSLERVGLELIDSVKLYRYGNLEISLADPYKFLSYLEKLSEISGPEKIFF